MKRLERPCLTTTSELELIFAAHHFRGEILKKNTHINQLVADHETGEIVMNSSTHSSLKSDKKQPGKSNYCVLDLLRTQDFH